MVQVALEAEAERAKDHVIANRLVLSEVQCLANSMQWTPRPRYFARLSPRGRTITQSYTPLEVLDKNQANAAGAADRCNRRDRKPYNAAGRDEILES